MILIHRKKYIDKTFFKIKLFLNKINVMSSLFPLLEKDIQCALQYIFFSNAIFFPFALNLHFTSELKSLNTSLPVFFISLTDLNGKAAFTNPETDGDLLRLSC